MMMILERFKLSITLAAIIYISSAAIAEASCGGCCTCNTCADDSRSSTTDCSEVAESKACRQGKAGPKGETGAVGKDGQKGESGQIASGYLISKIESLGDDIRLLQMMVSDLETANNCMKNPTYTYQVTPNNMNWYEARRYCQSIDGDLAVHGMKDFETRLSIKNRFVGSSFWIGASDLDHEGVWKWVDGKLTSDDDIHWAPRQPNDSNSREDCGCIKDGPNYNWRSNDSPCTLTRLGLCEIPVKC